ncbi:MAG: cellulase family glycosylhydrolase [Anaerolineae bacterium]|nr:cellulase family glycosylhydrolase [Anaerolineae bacterium]
MSKSFPVRAVAFLEDKRNAMALNVMLAVGFVAGLLFLPPLSACNRISGVGYQFIGSQGGSLTDPDGTQVTLQEAAGQVYAKLTGIPRLDFLEGKASESYYAAATNVPGHLRLKSPLYDLQVRGQLPRNPGAGVRLITYSIPIPNDAEPYEALSLYEWTGNSWRFVPSHVIPEDDQIEANLDYVPGPLAVFHQEPVVPAVSADLHPGTDVVALAQGATEANPMGLYLLEDGSLGGSLPPEVAELSPEAWVVPVVRNWGPDGVVRCDYTDNVLAIPELTQAHIEALVQAVDENEWTGIELEYREVNPELRERFTEFVRELSSRLHAMGKVLGIRVSPPIQIADDRWVTGAFDWRALGMLADRLVVPVPADLNAYRTDGSLARLLSWATGEVERYRLYVDLPALSREKVLNYILYRRYDDILASFGRIELENGNQVGPEQPVKVRLAGLTEWSGLQYDEATHTHWFSYRDPGGTEHVVQLEDPGSLAYKLALIGSYRLRGVAVTGTGQHPDTWRVLADYRNLVVSDPREPVALSLALQGDQFRNLEAGAGAWEVKAPAQAGSYALQAALLVGSHQSRLDGGTLLEVVSPTATAAPEPTATPTPRPLPTDTAVPVPTSTSAPGAESQSEAPAEAPPPTATPAPVVAPPPSGGGGFGYGVQAHVIHNGQAPQVMAMIRGMGFNWVKQQIEWKLFEPSKGDYQWGAIDEVVDAANAAGINVLLSVVKAPAWARPPGADLSVEGPPANPQDFADFLGAMAARYRGRVRAYEVWNEQNLHYEWGNEPIDPGRYVELLKHCYAAIKANDPGALVISGALTPTGAQPPLGMDDFAYLEGMYRAGLKNYADGIGAHPSGYNVSPDVTWEGACEFIKARQAGFTGACDTPHHSWSFRSTMEGYRNIMVVYGDGGKKIWPTEFGWASSPAPVVHYEYAADNSLQDQADWTVRAYQMARNWGWVGPMFLWNLNFKVVAPGSEQAQWGIVDEGWGPLPCYSALAAMPK